MYPLIFILTVWFVSSTLIDLHQYFLPSFVATFEEVYKEMVSGSFAHNLLVTLGRVFSGLIVGLIFGGLIGIVLGLNARARSLAMPIVEFIRGIPTSMLFPVFIVSLGVGELSKSAIIATATFPIIIVSIVVGCASRSENQDRRDYILVHAEHLALSTKYIAILWDAIPSILSGVKVSISMALVLTIVTEMFFVASSGVGWAAYQAYQSFNLELMYSYILLVGFIGVLINVIFDRSVQSFEKKIGLKK